MIPFAAKKKKMIPFAGKERSLFEWDCKIIHVFTCTYTGVS